MKRTLVFLLALPALCFCAPAMAGIKVVHWSLTSSAMHYRNLQTSLKRVGLDVDYVESSATTSRSLKKDLEGAAAFVYTASASSSTALDFASPLAATLRAFAESGGLIIVSGDNIGWIAKAGLIDVENGDYVSSGELMVRERGYSIFDGISRFGLSDYWFAYHVKDRQATVLASVAPSYDVLVQKRIGGGSVLIIGCIFREESELAGRLVANFLVPPSVEALEGCRPKVSLSLDKREALPGEYVTATSSISNPCDEGRDVELKFYQITPTSNVTNLLAEPRQFSLLPQDDFKNVAEIGIAVHTVEGFYRIGVVLVNPVTGHQLARDMKTYRVK